jgi:divalent metal cation (Fe/Co/Zn/Cd) transporter
LDGVGAMMIGIAIAVCSVFLIAGIKDLLIGRSAAPEVEDRIKKAALSVDEVQDVLGIRTLHIGSEKLLVDLDVHMEARLTTRELEQIIDKIKSQIRAEVPSVKFIQVELETPRKT